MAEPGWRLQPLTGPPNPSITINARVWNKFSVGGIELPGLARITGSPTHKLVIQKRGASGKEGPAIIFHGRQQGSFGVDLLLHTAAEWAAWQAAKDELPLKQPGKGASLEKLSRPVYHPLLAHMGITYAYCAEITVESPVAGGPIRVRMNWEEYVQPGKQSPSKRAQPAATKQGYGKTIDLKNNVMPATTLKDITPKPSTKVP